MISSFFQIKEYEKHKKLQDQVIILDYYHLLLQFFLLDMTAKNSSGKGDLQKCLGDNLLVARP